MVRAMLGQAFGLSNSEINDRLNIKTFITQGDRELSGSLAKIGGKGLFTKEIEWALLHGEADIAIHSMKDMPAQMPDGLVIAAIPTREDPRDAFVCDIAGLPWELPKGSVFGTSSVRRRAQVLNRRPDLKIVPLRGNVGSRLQKLEAGEVDAMLLAEAGLKRLNKSEIRRTVLEPEEMLPAVSQGVLCVQMRSDDSRLHLVTKALACAITGLTSATERAFLTHLDGSCQTPIAGLATLEGKRLFFRAQLLSLDGQEALSLSEALTLGTDTTEERLEKAAEFGIKIAESIYNAAPASIQKLVRAA